MPRGRSTRLGVGGTVFLVTLVSLCAISLAVDVGQGGKVTVKLQIVEGDPSSDSVARLLNKKYQSGELNVGYPLLDLQIEGADLEDVTSGGPNTARWDHLAIIFSLFGCFLTTCLFDNSLTGKKANYKLVLLFCVFLSFLLLPSTISAPNSYDNCKLLNNEVDYRLYWTIQDNYIHFKATATATGWIALGLSGAPNMPSDGVAPGNDITLGYINNQGCENGCIFDYSTVVYDIPLLDSQQNAEFVSFKEENGKTTMEWKRLLDTGDSNNDRVIVADSTMYVLYAVNENTKPQSNSTFARHTTKGVSTITFSEPSECPSPDGVIVTIVLDIDPKVFDLNTFLNRLAQELSIPVERLAVIDVQEEEPVFCPDCIKLDFQYDEYTVPSSDTTYVCKGFEFPQDQKYHIVKFEPLKDNLQVLHHIVLYQSSKPFPSGYRACNMPADSSALYAWAPGENELILPDNVGMPVGNATGNLYGIMQMHYNNPTKSAAFIDSSGIRMYLSPQLRKEEAGLLFLGMDNGDVYIPPRKTAWHQQGVCPEQVTAGLGSTVLNVFSFFVHMHTRGKMIWTEHWRNGKQIANLGENMNYDFNSQGFKPINATIKARDELITHCVWNTAEEPSAVVGGESTSNEMCLNLILYYPVLLGAGSCVTSDTTGCDYGTANCPPPPN